MPRTSLLRPSSFLPQSFSEVFPHLVTATNAPKLCKIEDVNYSDVDAIFCCLPHATTQVRGFSRVEGQRAVLLTLGGHVSTNRTCFLIKTAVISRGCNIPRLSCALQEVIKKLPDHLKIVDLSADFRLRDPKVYAEWCVRGVTLVWRMKVLPRHAAK